MSRTKSVKKIKVKHKVNKRLDEILEVARKINELLYETQEKSELNEVVANSFPKKVP